jgi:hypothetical protein
MRYCKVLQTTYQLETRQDFIILFICLAQALPPEFLAKKPVILIGGGFASGKSLVAEVIAKTLDDNFNTNDLVTQKEAGKYFLESGPCAAITKPLTHIFQSSGKNIALLFKSGIGIFRKHAVETIRDQFNEAAKDTNAGALILSTLNNIRYNLLDIHDGGMVLPSIMIDTDESEFGANPERNIRLVISDPDLIQSEQFQLSMRNVKHLLAYSNKMALDINIEHELTKEYLEEITFRETFPKPFQAISLIAPNAVTLKASLT